MDHSSHAPSLDGAAMLDRYRRAQYLINGVLSKTVAFNTTLYPIWIGDTDCFWYEREKKDGKEYRLVDANAASNDVAFDHYALAAVLTESVKQAVDANNLPINQVEMRFDTPTSKAKGIRSIEFTAFDKRWLFDTQAKTCTEKERCCETEVLSPDGKYAAFSKDFNLWVREISSGEERALTRDGEACYVYAAPGTAWGVATENDTRIQARWSADSKRLFTVQRDTREVKELPIVHHVPQDGSVRPIVEYVKVAYPGDEHIETLRLVSVEVESGRVQAANYRQIPVTRNGNGFFSAKLGWWSTDSRHAYFVDLERDYKAVRVVEFDTHSGGTRVLFEETSATQINLMLNADELPTLVPLPETNELLWFSERSGWGHLYLYDLTTGALKNTVTQGDWLVRDVVFIDHRRRNVFIQTAGRHADRDPYYRDLCRVHLDTSKLTPLVSSDHEVLAIAETQASYLLDAGVRDIYKKSCGVSPTGNFAVVTQSRADTAPVSFLVSREGHTVLELEIADVSGLPDGWQWLEPVKLLAADGITDIYGLVFRPSNFSADKPYPVVSHVYSAVDYAHTCKGSFTNGSYGLGISYLDPAALAELGFIVVQIDGRGTPIRHKAFLDESYGRLESVSNLDDHVAGLKQLAKRYPYMDLQRVGISNHMGGGPGGIQGLLKHPEFYKVGVSLMPHDSRLFAASMWGDKYEGLSGPYADELYPEAMVEKLEGKLLLISAMLDPVCPPAIVFRMVEALQKANKDFDLLLLPNLGHSPNGYVTRRAYDFLVRHLLETEPPKEFKLESWIENLS